MCRERGDTSERPSPSLRLPLPLRALCLPFRTTPFCIKRTLGIFHRHLQVLQYIFYINTYNKYKTNINIFQCKFLVIEPHVFSLEKEMRERQRETEG